MLVEFGRFGRPRGVRGEVRFWPHNPASPLLVAGRHVRIGRTAESTTNHLIERVHRDRKGAVVKIAGCDDREAAAQLTHQRWFEPRDGFAALEPDEIYIADLIGMTARVDDRTIGRVVDVVGVGPHDILVIADGRRRFMVPNVPDFVTAMDLDAGEISISPIEGLLPADLVR